MVDPFAGTGSMLFPSVALGALHVVGLDINVQGTVNGSGVTAPLTSSRKTSRGNTTTTTTTTTTTAAADTAAAQHVTDVPKIERVRANARQLPFRDATAASDGRGGSWDGGGLFDACICDPPYGLRKPRMVTEEAKDSAVENAEQMQAAVAAAMVPVVEFAASGSGLVVGGRLVFLFPSFDFSASSKAAGPETKTAKADKEGELTEQLLRVLPQHAGMQLVSVSVQTFKGMSRHAVVMERRLQAPPF